MKRVIVSLAAAAVALTPMALAQVHSARADMPEFTNVCAVAHPQPHQMQCFAIVHNVVQPPTSSPAFPSGYHPADLQAAYNLVNAAKTGGTGQTVALVDAYDYPTAESDLGVYRKQFGLPPCTTANGCFKKVNDKGQTSPLPPTMPSVGWQVEEALDIDMVSAICPNCHILLVEGFAPADVPLGTGVDSAVKLGATEVSNSYGEHENESSQNGALLNYYNHKGVAITVSSGDSGYAFGPSYPADAPYVTAVGGTSLFKAPGTTRGWKESAWSGAGSGCSALVAKPSWQTDPLCKMRTIADVSAVADPGTGVAMYDTFNGAGGWLVVGGTSVSSPIIASVYALAGNASSVVYGSYPYSHHSASQINDVTTGNNGSCGGTYLCTAGPGYDGPTGWGTPNGTGGF